MATASTRVNNETILAASLAVAREKLGFGAVSSGLRVEAKPDVEPLSLAELERRGWLTRWRITQAEVDAAFAGTGLNDPDPVAPDKPFAELTLAYLNVPSIGRAILGDPVEACPLGRVNRQFKAPRPNALGVSDFTYVATWSGCVYVAFVIDAYARRSVG